MADIVTNQGLGKIAQWNDEINANSPNANAAFILVGLKVVEADSALRDYDTLAALLAGSSDECDFTNYARIVLDDADLAASIVDDTGDRRWIDTADPVWAAAGGTLDNDIVAVLLCYDSDTTGGTDTNIIPAGKWDFVQSTNGGDITIGVDTDGLWESTSAA